MPKEIELKIMLSPHNIPEITDWLNQQSSQKSQKIALGNDYFDTEDHFFTKHKMGLRIRSFQQQFEFTLKTEGQIKNGLHIRPEYNLPLKEKTPDLKSLLLHFELDKKWDFLPLSLAEKPLNILFSTHFERQKWVVTFQQSEFEIALDQGTIKNQWGENPICELEIELTRGNVNDLILYLDQIPKLNGMWLSNLSKAQRGYLTGQADKIKQKITELLNNPQDPKNRHTFADLILFVDEDPSLLTAFQQLSGINGDWQAVKNYLKSAEYFSQNIQQLTQRISQKVSSFESN